MDRLKLGLLLRDLAELKDYTDPIRDPTYEIRLIKSALHNWTSDELVGLAENIENLP